MKRLLHDQVCVQSLRVVLACLLLFASLAGGARPALAADVALSGDVRDQNGAPLAAVLVEILGNTDMPVASVTTGSDGRYEVHLSPGTYSLDVTPPEVSGFKPAHIALQNIAADKIIDIALIPLNRFTLSGRVTDSDGNPWRDMNVVVTPDNSGISYGGQTDVDGRYTFSAPAGAHDVIVSTVKRSTAPVHVWFQTAEPARPNYACDTALDVVLPVKRVDLVVQDTNGNPLPGAVIYSNGPMVGNLQIGPYPAAGYSGYTRMGSIFALATTDSFGRVRLWLAANDASKPYLLRIEPPAGSGYLVTAVPDVVVTSDTEITARLARPVTLSGRVTDRTGNGVAQQRVTLYSEIWHYAAATAVTDGAGRYSLRVAPGKYHLGVNDASATPSALTNYEFATKKAAPIEITENKTIDVTIPLQPLDVYVHDPAGNPIQGAAIETNFNLIETGFVLGGYPAAGLSYRRSSLLLTDSTGHAVVWLAPNIEGPPYAVKVTPPRDLPFAITYVSDVFVPLVPSIAVTLAQRAPFTVRVTGPDGTGLYNQGVQLLPKGFAYNLPVTDEPIGGLSMSPPIIGGRTDAAGTYADFAQEGLYQLQFTGTFGTDPQTTYEFTARDGTYSTLAANTSLPIVLPLKKVDVQVQDPAGNPLAGAVVASTAPRLYNSVRLGDLPLQGYAQSAGTTDADGKVALLLAPNAGETPYSLRISPPVGAPWLPVFSANVTVVNDKSMVVVLQNVDTACNRPPTAEAGGPYTVDEGGSVPLAGTGSDPDGRLLTYAWDLDGDGQFETSGAAAALKTGALDGPSSKTVTLRVCDATNMCASDQAVVNVVNVAPVVGAISAPLDPVPLTTAVVVAAPFVDPGAGDTHTLVWDWGDGSPAEQVPAPLGSRTASASHRYAAPGVYTIQLTVTDKDGGSGIASFQYVVVYDPDGGFVTGGGWLDSPPGACAYGACTDTTTGKATFGFVAKYKPGAAVPSGQTEFQFKAGSLAFRSDSYQWLVVAGAKAQYKGVGTINGAGTYGFFVTAIDGDLKGDNLDKFRIRIWDSASGARLYDNQVQCGAVTDGADPCTVISGGSIVVHKPEGVKAAGEVTEEEDRAYIPWLYLPQINR